MKSGKTRTSHTLRSTRENDLQTRPMTRALGDEINSVRQESEGGGRREVGGLDWLSAGGGKLNLPGPAFGESFPPPVLTKTLSCCRVDSHYLRVPPSRFLYARANRQIARGYYCPL